MLYYITDLFNTFNFTLLVKKNKVVLKKNSSNQIFDDILFLRKVKKYCTEISMQFSALTF